MKMKLYNIGSLVSQLGVLATGYVVVFKVSTTLGLTLLAFHGINELCEWLYRRETAKDNQQFFNELMEKYGNTKGTC